MKHIYIIFLLFTICFANITGVSASPKSKKSKWELIEIKDGIEMLERWVLTKTNVKVRERTGTMTLHCSADKVLALIMDETKTEKWMCNVEKVNVLKRESETNWHVHTILDAPWPFNKQDMVSNYLVTKNENTGVVKISVLSDNSILPKQKDLDRLDTFNAEWIIKPVGQNKVKVTFTTKSTRPPEYPSWVQDPVVRKIFISNLKNFKSLIAQA